MFSLHHFHPLTQIVHLHHFGFLHLCLLRCRHIIVPRYDRVGGCDGVRGHFN
jgi:hypothetical protein